MTRDELLEDIKKEVEKVLPENEELDGENLEEIQSCIEETLQNAVDTLDDDDEEETPEPEKAS